LDDYYAGAEGARRLMRELDSFLQHLVDNVEPAETLSCALRLRVKGGGLVSLKKIYRPIDMASDEGDTA
jgi:hypothetical protein